MLVVLKKIIVEFILWRLFFIIFNSFGILRFCLPQFLDFVVFFIDLFLALYLSTLINFRNTKNISKKFKRQFLISFIVVLLIPQLGNLFNTIIDIYRLPRDTTEIIQIIVDYWNIKYIAVTVLTYALSIAYINIFLNKKVSFTDDETLQNINLNESILNFKTKKSTVIIWLVISLILILQTISYFVNYQPYDGPAIHIDILVIIYPFLVCLSLSIFINKLTKFIIEKMKKQITEKSDALIFLMSFGLFWLFLILSFKILS